MWQNSTRRKLIRMATYTQASGNVMFWDVPKTGILSRVFLEISVTLAGTITGPNALGIQAAIKRVRLIANSGIDVFNMSGTGYNSLLANYLEHYIYSVPSTNARAAVSATTFKLPMVIPVGVNTRDPIGLIMLQNESTLLQLSVEMEAQANLGTSITTYNWTITPTLEVFTVPVDRKDWPAFNVIHQVFEDVRVVSGAGDVEYYWPRGNTYLQVLHGCGLAQSGSDAWSRAKVRLNQSDFIMDLTPDAMDTEFTSEHGYARLPGVVAFDLMGSSGLGIFGSTRDMLYSAAVTDLASVITATGATNLYTVRRQLVSLEG
jgi:hypothetical protein